MVKAKISLFIFVNYVDLDKLLTAALLYLGGKGSVINSKGSYYNAVCFHGNRFLPTFLIKDLP